MSSIYRQTLKGQEIDTVSATPTLTVHAGYVAGDYVGTTGTAMTFTNCARVEGGGGFVVGATVLDLAGQSVAGELWLFDSDPTPPADSAAWTITDGDLLRLVGIIPIPAANYYASGANSVGQSDTLSIAFRCASGSRDLRGCFVTRGAPAYPDGGLAFVLRIIRS